MPKRTDNDDIQFNGLIGFKNIPIQITTQWRTGVTTPSAFGVNVASTANTVPVSVTDIIGAVDGQYLRILGDGLTTIVNSARMRTNTGANKLLAASKVYRFTYFDSIHQWIEDA